MNRPVVAVTMGEPGGVGGEIVVAAWQALRGSGGPIFLVIDDPERLGAIPGTEIVEGDSPQHLAEQFDRALPVIPEPLLVPASAGTPSPANAPAVLRSIERAVQMVRENQATALVTSPIDKNALSAGLKTAFLGHTAMLGRLAGARQEPVMMMVAGSLRIVPVTTHLPLRQVPDVLSRELILHAGQVAAQALRGYLGAPRARIAVSGLNPHSGEDGLLGDEESAVIAPAVTAMQEAGIDAWGPIAADSLFTPFSRRRFDAALCMYHDQALAPIKALNFRNCVNVTLGLPFTRTSPGHGVGYDIAGTGAADPGPLIAAIRTAARIAERRRRIPG